MGLNNMNASDAMVSNWYGYGSMLGFRFYLSSSWQLILRVDL